MSEFKMNDEELEECILYSKSLKVLFVEDNTEFANQAIKLFNNFFDNITLAINGIDGINKFKNGDFDIVISDINMPDSDGLSMIKELKTLDYNIPIIMLTAYDDSPLIIECVKVGIYGYMLKPIQLDQLTSILERINKQYIPKQVIDKIKVNDDFIWIPSTSQLSYRKVAIKLTANEIKFISHLINNRGAISGYIEINEVVFNEHDYNKKRIANLTNRLKNKVGDNLFESLYGEGYRIKFDNYFR